MIKNTNNYFFLFFCSALILAANVSANYVDDLEKATADLAKFKNGSSSFMDDVDLYRQTAYEVFENTEGSIMAEIDAWSKGSQHALDINKALLDRLTNNADVLVGYDVIILDKYKELVISVAMLRKDAVELNSRIYFHRYNLASIPRYPATYFSDLIPSIPEGHYTSQINALNASVTSAIDEFDALVDDTQGMLGLNYLNTIESLVNASYIAFRDALEAITWSDYSSSVRSRLTSIQDKMASLNLYATEITEFIAEGHRLDRLALGDKIFSAQDGWSVYSERYDTLYDQVSNNTTLDIETKLFLVAIINSRHSNSKNIIYGTENLNFENNIWEAIQVERNLNYLKKLIVKHLGKPGKNNELYEKERTTLNGCIEGQLTITMGYNCQLLGSLIGITESNVKELTKLQKYGIEKIFIKVEQGPIGGYAQ